MKTMLKILLYIICITLVSISKCWAGEDDYVIIEKTSFIFSSTNYKQHRSYCLPRSRKLIKIVNSSSQISGAVEKPMVNITANVEKNCIEVTAKIYQKRVCTDYPVISGLELKMRKKCANLPIGNLYLNVTYESLVEPLSSVQNEISKDDKAPNK